ncbi:MAG TPA: YtxH domain-containing protein [Terriglobales bacterium]|nr:YtxH domain-containing protein [Terriglobales bacterium]
MKSRKKRDAIHFGWAFLAGLGAGTTLGMLMAPKSGAELRNELGDYARQSYEQGRDRVQPVVDQARQKIQPAIERARERVHPLMEDVTQSVDSVMAQASSVRDRVVERAGKIKDGRTSTSARLLVVLNEWPHERLIEIDGIGPVLASKIIQHRPYQSEQQLIELRELPPSAIESLRKAA